MVDLVIKDLDQKVLERLKENAAVQGTTPEEEARKILCHFIPPKRTMTQDEAFRRLDERRKKYAHLQKTDSVDLLREDRDR